MNDPSYVNSQVIEVINQSQAATMGHQVVLTSGAGKAYQSVAQSTAIAVQDAADALRNITTIATTAAGVAIAQLLATGEGRHADALGTAQNMMKGAAQDFADIGASAATILKAFPSG